MGTVYRAVDRVTGAPVAVKVLSRQNGRSLEISRFIREGRILAELQHPNIVGYVDRGQLPDGMRYLVMEWLTGEDLARRLEHGALTVAEVVRLLRQVGGALAAAHQLDIVHRDIKPSNLFLCSAPVDRVVLLDFGVAHYEHDGVTALTAAGAIVGTLQYMAPEQAGGERRITPAADIYSLGRVAYQCLAGRQYRQPVHAAAALARALFEEIAPLSHVNSAVPQPLSGLIGRMLARDPAQRPLDGRELLRALDELGELATGESFPSQSGGAEAELAVEEQSLYSIVLAVPGDGVASGGEGSSPRPLSGSLDRAGLDATLLRHRAQPHWLLDGSLLLSMLPSESAHDQAAHAARCALIIKARWVDAAVALATGRGQALEQHIVGEVVDRAARLLSERRQVEQAEPQVAAAAPRSVWVDVLSASLLDRRFALLLFPSGALLTGEAISSEDARPVRGVIPPCFGREQELTILDAMIERCASDSIAQAVLATAPPGHGKTRLRQEFLQRLRRRSRPPTVMMGSGELFSCGTPYGVIGALLRRHFGIDLAAGIDAGRARLTEAVAELVGPESAQRCAPFLGEACGVRFEDDDQPELRTARLDPQVMSALVAQSFVQILDGLAERGEVVLLLDDLHWGDLQTVSMVESALRELESRPILVLALARPEVRDAFPRIRHWPHITELPLSGLSRNASERFVRFVLGSAVTPEAVKLLAQQAAGNALLLEELVRAQGESAETQSSETVIAVLQARIQRLAPPTRLALQKASIFGARFSLASVLSLTDGNQVSSDDLDAELRALTQAELITAHRARTPAQGAGDSEYSFRHALMRDAAYGLLSDKQRRRWHRSAGLYLLGAGEPDALVLAEHFSRSDEPRRAFPHFVRAAAGALEVNDVALVRQCVRRGEESLGDEAPTPALLGELRAIQAITQYRLGDLDACLRLGEEAVALLNAGGNRWSQMMYSLLSGSMMMGREAQFMELARRFIATAPLHDARASYVETSGVMLTNLCLFGQRDVACEQIRRVRELGREAIERQAGARAWFYFGQSRLSCLLDAEPWLTGQYTREAAAASARTGNGRWMCIMHLDAALAERDLGTPEFEPHLRQALDMLRAIHVDVAPGYAAVGAAAALARIRERADEAAELARGVLARNRGNAYFAGMAHLALAEIGLTAGGADVAAAGEALAFFATMPPLQLVATAVLAQSLLRTGQAGQARAACEEGLRRLAALGGVGLYDLRLRLAAIDAFVATGDARAADVELSAAIAVLQRRALAAPDAVGRRRYLIDVPEHRRLVALAQERLREREMALGCEPL